MDPLVRARRELVAVAVLAIGAARLVDPPLATTVALLAGVGTALATLEIFARTDQRGVPVESLILPSLATFACATAIRLVPLDAWLVPALVGAAFLVDAATGLELRLLTSPEPPDASDRTILLGLGLILAFLGFTGAAALVPGGLVEPVAQGSAPLPSGGSLSGGALAILAAADALVAGLVGYRMSAVRSGGLRDALWSAISYAAVAGIGAAALRAIAIPRLLAPALLAVVIYLWDAYRGSPRSVRRSARWIWEAMLLSALAVAVIAWNLLNRN